MVNSIHIFIFFSVLLVIFCYFSFMFGQLYERDRTAAEFCKKQNKINEEAEKLADKDIVIKKLKNNIF